MVKLSVFPKLGFIFRLFRLFFPGCDTTHETAPFRRTIAFVASAQETSSPGPGAPKVFPGPDFVIRDKDLKPQKSGMVLGPPQSDGKGGTKGSLALPGGLQIEVSSLSSVVTPSCWPSEAGRGVLICGTWEIARSSALLRVAPRSV
jgi:hypothetical protein